MAYPGGIEFHYVPLACSIASFNRFQSLRLVVVCLSFCSSKAIDFTYCRSKLRNSLAWRINSFSSIFKRNKEFTIPLTLHTFQKPATIMPILSYSILIGIRLIIWFGKQWDSKIWPIAKFSHLAFSLVHYKTSRTCAPPPPTDLRQLSIAFVVITIQNQPWQISSNLWYWFATNIHKIQFWL